MRRRLPIATSRYAEVSDKLLLKLRARHDISPEEEDALRQLPLTEDAIGPRHTLIRAGQDLDHSVLLLEGYMCRYKDLGSGDRQISEIHVPGDFVDLHSFTLKRLDHSIMSLTECKYAVVPHSRLDELATSFPHLARVLWFSTTLDAAIHREWMLSLGRRSALSRLAHLFVELLIRLDLVGLVQDQSYELPLTEEHLAECMGLTAVHVHRMLKDLRDCDRVTFRAGRVKVKDLPGLKLQAEFSDDYLFLKR